jgi:cardiolipin synthase
MKAVYVVFPVLRGSRRFFVEKGRRWSVIEHLLLDAVCRTPASAALLATKSCLPRRVVIEALIRLMRAGWVEISSTALGPVFRATLEGVAKAPLDQLPAATVTEPKWRGFAIEQVTGGVFRRRELTIVHPSRLPASSDDQIVVSLLGSKLHNAADLAEVFTAIEGEDELIVGLDRSPEKLTDGYGVVTVSDGIIDGLPYRATQGLRNLILSKAQEAIGSLASNGATTVAPSAVVPTPSLELPQGETRAFDAPYENGDLIIDGEAHSAAFDKIIRGATERLIIHSTFISDARAQTLLPKLLQAASKGVAIDILWGQDDVGTATNSSRSAADRLKASVKAAGRSDLISIHPFSTRSHAKIVVADNGKREWTGLLGSCNWLASDFTSFETSVRLRDPAMIGALICTIAGLSRGRPGVWNDFAIDLTVLGRRIGEMPRSKGRTVPMRLLFGVEHAKLVLEARDHAKKRIFVLSHRIGIAGRPVTLLPTLAAVRANGVNASIYYGRTTGPLSGIDGAGLIREFAKEGVEISPVHRPRLHAKVLGWDDNALAVTSLNWLSADPADAESYREIGVLLEVPRIADNFIRQFENSRND